MCGANVMSSIAQTHVQNFCIATCVFVRIPSVRCAMLAIPNTTDSENKKVGLFVFGN